MNYSLVFAGREREVARLRECSSSGKCALLVGPPGIGKSALLQHLRGYSPMLVCEESSSLRRICDSLESQLGWTHFKLTVIERKNRLLDYLSHRKEPVAFDHVAQTPPRVGRFMGHLSRRIPVWIACRSDRMHDIGHVWEFLPDFVRLEIHPLTRGEVATLVEYAVSRGSIQNDAGEYISQLYRLCQGNPRALEELLIEMAARKYELGTSAGCQLLDIDRRIHEFTRNDTLTTTQSVAMEGASP